MSGQRLANRVHGIPREGYLGTLGRACSRDRGRSHRHGPTLISVSGAPARRRIIQGVKLDSERGTVPLVRLAYRSRQFARFHRGARWHRSRSPAHAGVGMPTGRCTRNVHLKGRPRCASAWACRGGCSSALSTRLGRAVGSPARLRPQGHGDAPFRFGYGLPSSGICSPILGERVRRPRSGAGIV